MKQLIVNADDFGLHELINEGIVEGHRKGCITSASIMAGGSAFEQAAKLARQHPTLGIGVHLTLVGASPVARGDIRTLLAENGLLFSNYRYFVKQYLCGHIAKEHIEYELRCQMQRVVGKGITITHIDSHQHLHVLPGMAKIIGKIAREFNVTKVRMPAEPFSFLGTGPLKAGRMLARTILSGCAEAAKRSYTRQGLSAPQHFFGMLAGGDMRQADLINIIQNLPDGSSEIMVHPGKNTQALEALFPWGYRWQDEMEALKAEEVLDTIQKNDIQLIHYGTMDKTHSRDKGRSK